MIPIAASAGLVILAPVIVPPLAHVARLEPRASLGGTGRRLAADLLRTFAALAAIPLLVGGTNGDLLVAGCLAAAALGRRSPAAGLTLVLVATVAALRAGSSAVGDVAGTHAVLGPAVLSPSIGVAAAAGFAFLAAVAAAASAIPPPLRGEAGRHLGAALRIPAVAGDAVVVVAALSLGCLAVAGPVFADGVSPGWTLARLVVLVASLGVATLVLRLRTALGPRVTLAHAAAGLAAIALALALTAQ